MSITNKINYWRSAEYDTCAKANSNFGDCRNRRYYFRQIGF